MAKLVLWISKDDPLIADGGPLADKTWQVSGDVAVTAKSGYGPDGYPHGSGDGPRVAVHGRDHYWANFEKPFDIAVFEAALSEAKACAVLMREVIDQTIAKLKAQ